jgi:hypothetical protein
VLPCSCKLTAETKKTTNESVNVTGPRIHGAGNTINCCTVNLLGKLFNLLDVVNN